MATDPADRRPDSDDEESLFAAALQWNTPEQRAAYLDEACQGRPEVRQRVEALLKASEEVQTFLERPAMAPPDATQRGKSTVNLNLGEILPMGEGPGDTIGRYKILQQIGEGGCGTVFMAEQEEPVRRRVALKVIKLGMDTKSVVARFEAERQALALMDHPNIAKVLDAGATDSGRPYFVMELVRGIPITTYCDQARTETSQRLNLFIQVCQAVQHAHQKGIIHRDLKPSNILVTLQDGEPVPKVIDFGIAKATEGRLTDRTLFTAFEQFIGTPAYMSPEQAELSSIDIDTRSDIYSLGILLYELLTGRPPFDPKELAQAGIDEVRRRIREVEPHRPSTRLSTLAGDALDATARSHGTDSLQLVNRIRGDLDWIVMRCLEKDRTRRYESASGLVADVRRHLNSEPVVARPPSASYRFFKAVRRNRLLYASGAAVLLALLLGLAMSTLQAFRASRAEADQRRLANEARDARDREASGRAQTVAALEEVREARNRESLLRKEAEDQRLDARRRAYASDMALAHHAINLPNIREASEILDRHRPEPGQPDLRGWEWRYLWQFCRSDALYELGRYDGIIRELSMSSDGRLLCVIGEQDVALWDLFTRREIEPSWQDTQITAATFAPGSNVMAISWKEDDAGGVAIANPLTPADWHRMEGKDRAYRLRFSSNGKQLLGLTADVPGGTRTRALVWDVASGRRLRSVELPTAPSVSSVGQSYAVSPDLSLIVEGSIAPGSVSVQSSESEEVIWSATAAEERVTAAAFSPDGRILATGAGYAEGSIRLWDARNGAPLGQLDGHRAWVSGLEFTQDGQRLVSVSADQTVRIWNLKDLKTESVLKGHKTEVWRVAGAAGARQLITADGHGRILVWDHTRRTGHSPATILRGTWAEYGKWTFSSDGMGVLAMAPDRSLSRWSGPAFENRETVISEHSLKRSNLHLAEKGGVALVREMTHGHVTLYDLTVHPPRSWSLPMDPSIDVLGLSPDGGSIIGLTTPTSSDSELLVLDAVTTGVRAVWPLPPAQYPERLPITGEWILTTAEVKDGWNWRAINWKTGVVSPDHVVTMALLANTYDRVFSPDSRYFAVATEPHVARVFSLPELKPALELKGHLMGEKSIGFSLDGRRIATTSAGKEALKIWDADSRQCVLTLEGEGSMQRFTRFSADGNLVGTVNQAGLHVWRAPDWKEIAAAEDRERATQASLQSAPEAEPATVHALRGFRRHQEGQTGKAIESWRQALALAPSGLLRTRTALGEALIAQGNLAEALSSLRPAGNTSFGSKPSERMRQLLGIALLAPGNDARHRRPGEQDLIEYLLAEDASADLNERIRRLKDAANIRWWLRHTNQANQLLRNLPQHVANSSDPVALDRFAKAILSHPAHDPSLQAIAMQAARRPLGLTDKYNPNRFWFEITAAMASIRAGQDAEARPRLEAAIRNTPVNSDTHILALAWRSLLHARAKDAEAARKDIAIVQAFLSQYPAAPTPSLILLRPDALAALFAIEEASALLK